MKFTTSNLLALSLAMLAGLSLAAIEEKTNPTIEITYSPSKFTACWPIARYIYLAAKDPRSIFSTVPPELIPIFFEMLNGVEPSHHLDMSRGPFESLPPPDHDFLRNVTSLKLSVGYSGSSQDNEAKFANVFSHIAASEVLQELSLDKIGQSLSFSDYASIPFTDVLGTALTENRSIRFLSLMFFK